MPQRQIAVIGSINMDLVTRAARFPKAGETLLGLSFQRFMGGKGANQAVAAARLGANVCMIGAVGDDDFGREMLANLRHEGVITDSVNTLTGLSSGIANITVAGTDNTIVVYAGANFGISVADIEAQEASIAQADVVLAQLEIPLDCVLAAAKIAEKHQKPFILNPAPAQALPTELLQRVTLLTPNAHELAISLGLPPDSDQETLMGAAPCPVLMTIGSQGALFNDNKGKIHHISGFQVEAVDTTGAGDTFNGALAVYWHEGITVAAHKACAAAALAVTKDGAQSGMPLAGELTAFLAKHQIHAV